MSNDLSSSKTAIRFTEAKLPRGFGFVSFCILSILISAPSALAQVDFGKRQQERRSSRWTISDWFDQKKRISDQNSWLSVKHANQVPIDGALFLSQSPDRIGMGFDVYLTRIGVRLSYERPVNYLHFGGATADIGGSRSAIDLQWRLFGSSIQDTHIVIRGGAEYDDVQGVPGYSASYLGWGLEPEVQIYFAKFLGVWGSWRYRFAAKPADNRNLSLSGSSWKTAAFIEAGAIRLEAGYQARDYQLSDSANSSATDVRAESLFAGIRFFF